VHKLDAVRHQMRIAEPVLKALDSELANISFDPTRRDSIDTDIERVLQTIDSRLESFKNHPVLGPIARQLKSQYVEGIQDRVDDLKPKRP
jgi:hypothetical protein